MAAYAHSFKEEAWPSLPLAEWQETCDTLHMWTQVVGKVRLELSPHINHWWEVPLYVSARGLTTSPIPCPRGIFEVLFDFIDHTLHIVTSWNESRTLRLHSRTVADFYAHFMNELHALGIDVHIWPMPVEVPDPIRFDQDETHSRYDPGIRAPLLAAAGYSRYAFSRNFARGFWGKSARYISFGEVSTWPVRVFQGGRAPERPGADKITRDAYSHEVISAGWWPGGGAVADAAFYAYAAPEPNGLRDAHIGPQAAFYHTQLNEFILPYEDVRISAEPRQALLEFLETTYEAAANLGKWDRASLEKRV